MITDEIKKITENLKDSLLQNNPNANVGKTDRIISIGTGSYILFKGITNLFSSPLLALTEVSIGGGLLYRGITGYCAVKEVVDNLDEDKETTIRVESYPTVVTPL